MSKLMSSIIAAALASVIVGAPAVTSAAERQSLYDKKNAECKQQAKAKNFGIHFIQRNRWINECIARR